MEADFQPQILWHSLVVTMTDLATDSAVDGRLFYLSFYFSAADLAVMVMVAEISAAEIMIADFLLLLYRTCIILAFSKDLTKWVL
jgi:hypothetical protein